MTTHDLVGGAWLGGWCWQPVAEQLRHAGHRVYPATLTGLGERVHLANADVDLETHISDVVNLIEFEDLRDVVLVGHSYAGIVVTGVADRVPERLAQVVYLDAGPVPDGTRFLDMSPHDLIEQKASAAADPWRLPMPTWEELEQVFGANVAGLDAATRGRIRARAVDTAARHLPAAVSADEPGAGGTLEVPDLVQLPVGASAGDDRERSPLVRRAVRP